MTPEIEAVLNGIGFMKARSINRSLIFHSFTPGQRPGLYRDKNEAGKAHETLTALRVALLALPTRAAELIDHHSRTPEDWDAG